MHYLSSDLNNTHYESISSLGAFNKKNYYICHMDLIQAEHAEKPISE